MPKKKPPTIETRQERWKRENLLLAIEEVTGIVRERWELKTNNERSILRIRRMYVYLMHTLLHHSHWGIVGILGDISQPYVNKSIQIVKGWVSDPESEPDYLAELNAIIKNYEERPAYNFDTIA